MEISTRIANLLRDIARAEVRSEEEVLDDALALYQRWVPEHHSAEEFAEFQKPLTRCPHASTLGKTRPCVLP